MNGWLSVKAHGEPLRMVLREIARQTGVVIEGADGLSEPVVSEFGQVPLVEGLRRLLSGRNFLILEQSGELPWQGAGTRVVVLATTGAVTAEVAPGSVFVPAGGSNALDDALREDKDIAEFIERNAATTGDRDVQALALDVLDQLNTSSSQQRP